MICQRCGGGEAISHPLTVKSEWLVLPTHFCDCDYMGKSK